MLHQTRSPLPLHIHATNVTALGPAQVVGSLLPALEACPGVDLQEIHLPGHGPLAGYAPTGSRTEARAYRRYVPSGLSRILECTLLAGHFDTDSVLLVLGDIPLACRARQVVFVQTAHVIGGPPSPDWRSRVRNRLARALFSLNASRVSRFIVQTEVMKQLLEENQPATRGKTVVIPQPPPSWLLGSGLKRVRRAAPAQERLHLLYPAAGYAHKNHALLAEIAAHQADNWPVGILSLTLPSALHPNSAVDWIRCVGTLDAAGMLREYGAADALVYLSTSESYGLPLVEAMHVGLPIVACDLPYARTLCGDQAIYFEPHSIDSLRLALTVLHDRLASGWWPQWQDRLARIPPDWSSVAQAFVEAMDQPGAVNPL
jgi:glycosyltransferase involved in cell wall biosynthesis